MYCLIAVHKPFSKKSASFHHQVSLLNVFDLVISLALSPDGTSYICGSSMNELAFCHTVEGMISLVNTPNPGNLSLSIRDDSRLVAIGGKDGTYWLDKLLNLGYVLWITENVVL